MPKTLNTLLEQLRRLYPMLLPIAVILFWAMGFSLISFLAAEASSDQQVMSTYLDGRVPNHGSYYRWFTIANHPFLFGFSIVLLLGAWFVMVDAVMLIMNWWSKKR